MFSGSLLADRLAMRAVKLRALGYLPLANALERLSRPGKAQAAFARIAAASVRSQDDIESEAPHSMRAKVSADRFAANLEVALREALYAVSKAERIASAEEAAKGARRLAKSIRAAKKDVPLFGLRPERNGAFLPGLVAHPMLSEVLDAFARHYEEMADAAPSRAEEENTRPHAKGALRNRTVRLLAAVIAEHTGRPLLGSVADIASQALDDGAITKKVAEDALRA
jgi:hypothetical protein